MIPSTSPHLQWRSAKSAAKNQLNNPNLNPTPVGLEPLPEPTVVPRPSLQTLGRPQPHESLIPIPGLGRIVRLVRMVRLIPALKSMVYLILAPGLSVGCAAAKCTRYLWLSVLRACPVIRKVVAGWRV